MHKRYLLFIVKRWFVRYIGHPVNKLDLKERWKTNAMKVLTFE